MNFKNWFFFLVFSNPFNLFGQDLYYRDFNSIDTSYAGIALFPPAKVADDFGPRSITDLWHGGIDYNEGIYGYSDLYDLIVAPENGVITNVNRMTGSSTYRQLCYQVGTSHRYIFGHLYETVGGNRNKNNGSIILKNMKGNNSLRWAQILIVKSINNNISTIDTFIYGQVSDSVVLNNVTLATTNLITAGNPLTPIGRSSTWNGSAYVPHLHLNTIPLNHNYSDGGTTYNGNPLQFIDYIRADYQTKLYCEYDTSLVKFVYPGTKISPIASKVKLDVPEITPHVTSVTYKRYSAIFDVDKVNFYLNKICSNSLNLDSLIIGPFKKSEISLGGRIGENKKNAKSITSPIWNTTGVETVAYNGSPSIYHNWDIYHYSDFISRIHKNATIADGHTNIAHNNEHTPD